tara:strand:- start:23 stop:226 length:204 start_codon:yes stop_codon:yes gene_type:complete
LFSAIAYKLKNPSKKARPPQLTSLEGLNKKKSFCCGGNIRQKYKLFTIKHQKLSFAADVVLASFEQL